MFIKSWYEWIYQPFKNVCPLLYFANVCHALRKKVFKNIGATWYDRRFGQSIVYFPHF